MILSHAPASDDELLSAALDHILLHPYRTLTHLTEDTAQGEQEKEEEEQEEVLFLSGLRGRLCHRSLPQEAKPLHQSEAPDNPSPSTPRAPLEAAAAQAHVPEAPEAIRDDRRRGCGYVEICSFAPREDAAWMEELLEKGEVE